MQSHTPIQSQRLARERDTFAADAASTPSRVLLSGSLAAVVALAAAVASSASAQTPVTPQRVNNQVGNRVGSTQVGVQPVTQDMAGRGNALGDGNSLGGQSFGWARGPSIGRGLGSGNALDANSQVGSGGFNAPSVQQDYYARNYIVTNSVPGGRGFRGSVGYTADTDFRGVTGSDAGYRFRADSAMSNPAFINSTAARDRFYVAQGLGVYEFRRDSTPIGFGAPSSAFGQSDSRLRIDRANSSMAIGNFVQSTGEDRYVATARAENGDQMRYIVSPLRGLQTENMTDPVVRSGLTLYEAARARDDIARGVATPADYELVRANSALLSRADTLEDQRVRAQSLADQSRVIDSRVLPSQYQEILDTIQKQQSEVAKRRTATGAAPAPDTPATPAEALDQLRQSLDALRNPSPAVVPSTEPKPAPGAGTDTPPTQPAPLEAPQGIDPQLEEKRVKERGKLLTVPELAETLRHGRTIDQLGPEDKRRVSQLIDEGEAGLRAGDYFKAERRFDQARILTPGNPLIEVGMAHAQLGAGLYLSASLTLRNLFTERPELIDAKYDRALLPAQDRLDKAIAVMRERVKLGDDVQGYGLVLAYIGHQTGNAALVEEGLSSIQGTPAYDSVRELLGGVWMPKK